MKNQQLKKLNKKAARERKFKRIRNLARQMFTKLANIQHKENIIETRNKRATNQTVQLVSTKRKKVRARESLINS